MKRLLYLYPEEWTGKRAREIHALQTCLALADAGANVTLITGADFAVDKALPNVGRKKAPEGFHTHQLSRRFLVIKSWKLFRWKFQRWMKKHGGYDLAFLIHLKAVPVVRELGLPYWWEAHEVFAETPEPGSVDSIRLDAMEQEALECAAGRIATSKALAHALEKRYKVKDFHIVPHGGDPPLPTALAEPGGPLVYAGSLANWKGLDLAIEAATHANIPVRVIGGNRGEWDRFVAENNISEEAQKHIIWKPRVPPDTLPERLSGARLGLSPTRPETASGRYSLPMKLFDYARCGIPAVCTALPSLEGLGSEPWCRQVIEPTIEAWVNALQYPASGAEEALIWAGEHTWLKRAEKLKTIMGL